MKLFFAMVIAYLIGSIPTGYLFAKSKKKIDLRQHGSGNVGATNVLRTVGKRPAVLTLLIDILKGLIAVTLWAGISYSPKIGLQYPEYLAVLGLTVVLGHNFSIFLHLKGGKGVATSAGVLLALCPKLLLVGLLSWIIIFSISKIVSLASIISAIAIPVASFFFTYPAAIRFLIVVLAFLIILTHRANIQRLLKGEEKRLSVRI